MRGPLETLARLRARGIRLAIDDFGTGFSSLDYLRRFPADRIKIARTFVNDLEQPGNAAVIRAIIGLARELGMRVIAEGIETEQQVERLAAWGCAEGQRYYFAQPLEAGELEPLLREDTASQAHCAMRPPEACALRGRRRPNGAPHPESLTGRYRRIG